MGNSGSNIGRGLRTAMARCGMSVWLGLSLAGCGGSDPEPAVPVPVSMRIEAASVTDLGVELSFEAAPANTAGLRYLWSFGDGNTSILYAPKHRYEALGSYEVKLRISNDAGDSREWTHRVEVQNRAHVRGLVCSGQDSSGWCWQNPTPSPNRFKVVRFHDERLGWRVGKAGEVFRTQDGGRSWQHLPTGETTDWLDLRVIDAQHLLLLAEGALWRSRDGGNSWARSGFPPVYQRDGVPPSLGVVEGSLIEVISWYTKAISTDDGKTWSSHSPSTWVDGSTGVLFRQYGYAIQRSSDGGKSYVEVLNWDDRPDNLGGLLVRRNRLLLTLLQPATSEAESETQLQTMLSLDGGGTWRAATPQNLGMAWPQGSCAPMDFDDAGLRLVVQCGETVLRSDDGGQLWQVLPLPKPASFEWAGDFLFVDGTSWLRGIYGQHYLSTDRGLSWRQLAAPAGNVDRSSFVVRRQLGAQTLLATDTNAIYLSDDLGQSWRTAHQTPAHGGWRGDLQFADAHHGWWIDVEGRLLQSADGGRSWLPLNGQGLPSGGYRRTWRFGGLSGWLLADAGLYRTDDGGKNWQAVKPEGQACATVGHQARFDSLERGWITSRCAGFGVMVTQDGGRSWRHVPTPYMWMDLLMEGDRWLLVGEVGQIHSSTDQGRSWTETGFFGDANLQGVLRVSDQVRLAWGDDLTLLRSVDGGLSWRRVNLGSPPSNEWGPLPSNVTDVHFINEQEGWLVGESGRVMKTTDGGQTWTRVSVPFDEGWQQVQFVDANTGWLRSGGRILATATGGN